MKSCKTVTQTYSVSTIPLFRTRLPLLHLDDPQSSQSFYLRQNLWGSALHLQHEHSVCIDLPYLCGSEWLWLSFQRNLRGDEILSGCFWHSIRQLVLQVKQERSWPLLHIQNKQELALCVWKVANHECGKWRKIIPLQTGSLDFGIVLSKPVQEYWKKNHKVRLTSSNSSSNIYKLTNIFLLTFSCLMRIKRRRTACLHQTVYPLSTAFHSNSQHQLNVHATHKHKETQ